jgi:hypothetical protein
VVVVVEGAEDDTAAVTVVEAVVEGIGGLPFEEEVVVVTPPTIRLMLGTSICMLENANEKECLELSELLVVLDDVPLLLERKIEDPAAMNNPTTAIAANIPGTEKAVLTLWHPPDFGDAKTPSDYNTL